jgi:hypothetical protein
VEETDVPSQHGKLYLLAATGMIVRSRGVTDSTTDFGSVCGGSNPSESTMAAWDHLDPSHVNKVGVSSRRRRNKSLLVIKKSRRQAVESPTPCGQERGDYEAKERPDSVSPFVHPHIPKGNSVDARHSRVSHNSSRYTGRMKPTHHSHSLSLRECPPLIARHVAIGFRHHAPCPTLSGGTHDAR